MMRMYVRHASYDVPDIWTAGARVKTYQHLIVLDHRFVDFLEFFSWTIAFMMFSSAAYPRVALSLWFARSGS
jgi:hypothetical protein